jgi:hypothetical protein
MNGKKARKLRKSLGMSNENLRQKEYGVTNKVSKIVYFRNRLGDLNPTKSERQVLVNKNLFYYRQVKKLKSRGFLNPAKGQ